ncbi:uncharacterized protein LOC144509724 [Mustelus asterias]
MDRPPSPVNDTSDQRQNTSGTLDADLGTGPPKSLPPATGTQGPSWPPALPLPVSWVRNVQPFASAVCQEASGQETGEAASREDGKQSGGFRGTQQAASNAGAFHSEQPQQPPCPETTQPHQDLPGTLGSGEGQYEPSHHGEEVEVKAVHNPYQAVQPHWFYCKEEDCKPMWIPFSKMDSDTLESKRCSEALESENVAVPTDGGRYDVFLSRRTRQAVYWQEAPTQVRRCTWFSKSEKDNRYNPYTEELSELIERAYKEAVATNEWNRKVEFPNGEVIILHNPKMVAAFHQDLEKYCILTQPFATTGCPKEFYNQ